MISHSVVSQNLSRNINPSTSLHRYSWISPSGLEVSKHDFIIYMLIFYAPIKILSESEQQTTTLDCPTLSGRFFFSLRRRLRTLQDELLTFKDLLLLPVAGKKKQDFWKLEVGAVPKMFVWVHDPSSSSPFFVSFFKFSFIFHWR